MRICMYIYIYIYIIVVKSMAGHTTMQPSLYNTVICFLSSVYIIYLRFSTEYGKWWFMSFSLQKNAYSGTSLLMYFSNSLLILSVLRLFRVMTTS